VAGKVTFAGKPVVNGIVVFENAAANISIWADLTEDGSYVLRTHNTTGLPPGTYQVAIRPRPQPVDGTDDPPTSALPGQPKELDHPFIPKKFHSTRTSKLAVEVQSGQNRPFDFELAP
jgi:hypothetical protein